MMLVSSGAAYFLNAAIAKARFGTADKMNFETPLTSLVWITSLVSIGLTYLISAMIIPELGGDPSSGGSWQPSFPAELWRGPLSRNW